MLLNFNRIEFDAVKNEAGTNVFTVIVAKMDRNHWYNRYHIKGGRYVGAYATAILR